MNKNAIKKFAISARTRLIATVSDKAGTLGITNEGISEPSSKGNGFEVYKASAGTEVMLQGSQIEQRRRLVAQVNVRGFDVVMEEVAYTWFNRICAIRFMEVNDYLPSRIRVLSSLKEGKNEPDLLTESPNVELDLSEKDKEWIINAKTENRLDELFSMLFIKQCNKLSEVLPELFEATEDYTEMLLNLSYTNKDDVIRMLVDGVDEKDFNVTTPDENGKPTGQVEIIGWLYQYYNTELKDDTFAQLKKNVKISKERIPAATQLFTPDWIVRYMVENTVGRTWIEHLRAVDPKTDEKAIAESFGWKYYLPEAEQEPEVNTKLSEIRKSYADIKPEDIQCIDPCMGSGHIIVAMFDILMDIYKSVGYGERDAAFEIVEHNLHGLDIDKRAYQLAYFAVMMKGRQYNRRFFRGKEEGQRPQPIVYAFVESNDVNRAQLKYFGAELNELEKNNAITQMNGLLDTFKDAREYGSILNVDKYDWDLLRRFTDGTNNEGQMTLDAVGLPQTQNTMHKIIKIGELLAKKYAAVVTNPPYMNNGGMSASLQDFLKLNYPDEKADMYSVFIKRVESYVNENGYYSMITQQGWMFLSSYVSFRKRLIDERCIRSLVQMGAHAFDEIQGEVVLVSMFVGSKNEIKQYLGQFIDLQEGRDEKEKEEQFFERKKLYIRNQKTFLEIPNYVIAYDASPEALERYNTGRFLSEYVVAKPGMQTSDNDRFLRLWFEVKNNDIGRNLTHDEAMKSGFKWFPYNKGIGYKKWYGNNAYIVNFYNDGEELKYWLTHNPRDPKTKHWSRNMRNYDYYFREGVTFTSIGEYFSARLNGKGYIFDTNGPTLFGTNLEFVCGFVNSVVFDYYNRILCKQITKTIDSVNLVPLVRDEQIPMDGIVSIVSKIISYAREDWDSFETSWDFTSHPMVKAEKMIKNNSIEAFADIVSTNDFLLKKKASGLEKSFWIWKGQCLNRFKQLKSNEEELNKIFIDIYGLQKELRPYVEDKDVSVRKANLGRDIRSLISYAVGCMFGRYSLDVDGLAYAGGKWESSKYSTFIPDKDNIIPITDEEYFEDDIVGLFCSWLKKVYGADTLEANLDFIANALGNKGDTSREVVRNYFLNDFFKDHCNTYSVTGSGKRPIYWLFDSGKQNGFKALIYLHRYDQDAVGRVRTDYLHKTQKAIEQAMQSAQYALDNSKSGTEKSRATKHISKYTKQLAEIQLYDEAIAHIANKRIALNLDDGVKANYEKFQGIEVSREGMKTVKVDLLAPI